MPDAICPRCGAPMETVEGEWGLIPGEDLPRFGSRSEIMVTPRRILRVTALRCASSDCGYLAFYTSTSGA